MEEGLGGCENVGKARRKRGKVRKGMGDKWRNKDRGRRKRGKKEAGREEQKKGGSKRKLINLYLR